MKKYLSCVLCHQVSGCRKSKEFIPLTNQCDLEEGKRHQEADESQKFSGGCSIRGKSSLGTAYSLWASAKSHTWPLSLSARDIRVTGRDQTTAILKQLNYFYLFKYFHCLLVKATLNTPMCVLSRSWHGLMVTEDLTVLPPLTEAASDTNIECQTKAQQVDSHDSLISCWDVLVFLP